MNRLVSIITPCYNSSKYIEETIKSIKEQTYNNWELIIVDDYSTDNSVDLVKKIILVDSRVKLIELKVNSGPAISRNVGIKMAKGDFITFIDSDDIWLPEFIENSIKFETESEGFVFSSYHRFDEELKPLYKDFIVPEMVSYNDILRTNSISCLTAFINVSKLGKLEMPNILYRQDMGLWLRYLKIIKFAYGIKKPLAIYRIRKKSHSRNKLKLIKHQWNFYRFNAKLSIFESIYFFTSWVLLGIKKYYL